MSLFVCHFWTTWLPYLLRRILFAAKVMRCIPDSLEYIYLKIRLFLVYYSPSVSLLHSPFVGLLLLGAAGIVYLSFVFILIPLIYLPLPRVVHNIVLGSLLRNVYYYLSMLFPFFPYIYIIFFDIDKCLLHVDYYHLCLITQLFFESSSERRRIMKAEQRLSKSTRSV